MEKILISACLLGFNYKYNGGNNYTKEIEKIKEEFVLIPVCPELFGGLPTPRDPSERLNDKIISCNGLDVTKEYLKGANHALQDALNEGIRFAITKEKSPACGVHKIYDGTHSKTLIDGSGVLVELLKQNNIKVFNENEIDEFLNYYHQENK